MYFSTLPGGFRPGISAGGNVSEKRPFGNALFQGKARAGNIPDNHRVKTASRHEFPVPVQDGISRLMKTFSGAGRMPCRDFLFRDGGPAGAVSVFTGIVRWFCVLPANRPLRFCIRLYGDLS